MRGKFVVVELEAKQPFKNPVFCTLKGVDNLKTQTSEQVIKNTFRRDGTQYIFEARDLLKWKLRKYFSKPMPIPNDVFQRIFGKPSGKQSGVKEKPEEKADSK
jgi:hypothetical protein